MKFISWLSLAQLGSCLALVACTGNVSPKLDPTEATLTSIYQTECENGQCPCPTPLGTIKHGSQVTVYDSDEVACNDSCESHSQTALCRNGKLDVDVTKTFFTCRVGTCSSCKVGNNLVRHGEGAQLYSKEIADCHQSCEDFKGDRVCNNGTLTGNPSFQYSTCQNRQCSCSLPNNGGFTTLGSSIKFYSVQQATCGKTCNDYSLDRTCELVPSGSFELTGPSSFAYTTCAEASKCSCILPNNLGTLPDGGTTALTTTPKVSCTQTCQPSATITVRCSNGNLTQTATNQVIDVSTTPYKNLGACAVDVCKSCQVSSSISIPHNSTYSFYNTTSPDCGNACLTQSRKCVDGNFDGNTAYTALTCALRECRCKLPDNITSVVLVRNSVPLFKTSNPACGQNCESVKKDFTCTEAQDVAGNWTYSFPNSTGYVASSCRNPQNCDCQLPGALGKIQDKITVTLHSQATAACGTTCEQIPNIKAICASGMLKNSATGETIDINAGNFSYKYQCQNSVCPACQLEGYGSIANNTSLTLYSKSKLECGDNLDLITAQFSCENNVLKKNGQIYVPPSTTPTWYTSVINNCLGCPTPWGVTVPINDSINFYMVSGSVANPCGRGCKVATRKCLESGKFDGVESDFVNYKLGACPNTCTEQGGGAPPRLCLLPWQNAWVTPDAQIPMWKKRRVGCGESCQNHFKLGRCEMSTGAFDAGFEYLYQSCTEVCP